MSKQSFTAVFREALWITHRKRCLYCKRPKTFAEIEVDHVVPEATSDEQLKLLRAAVGFPETFDVRGYENLAPACRPCNSDKGSINLAPGATAIHLARINEKLPALKELLARRTANFKLDAGLRIIAKVVEQGGYTQAEIYSKIQHVLEGVSSPLPDPSVLNQYLSHNSQLRFSRHALDRIGERGIDHQRISDTILSGTRNGVGHFEVIKENGTVRLRIEIDDEIEVICRINDQIVTIITVMWLDKWR